MSDLKVRVRMYKGIEGETEKDGVTLGRGLLGDCFLLSLMDGTSTSHILIDCGILSGLPKAKEHMVKVAKHVQKETNGKLDLLVVTHEHWDHISGFSYAQDVFFNNPNFKIQNLWMAWTENLEHDQQAQRLADRFDKRKKAFAIVREMTGGVAKATKANSPFGLSSADALDGLDQFIGPDSEAALAIDNKTLRGAEIMAKLKAAIGKDQTRYLEPGACLTTPGALGLKTYVLGPPRNEKFLFKDLPSKKGHSETYFDQLGFNEPLLFGHANLDGENFNPATEAPFSKRHRWLTFNDVKNAKKNSPQAVQWLKDKYLGADEPERRIDGEWLAIVGPMALKLDSDTNNTSLVLMFVLPDKTNMVFAADAQVGNWESWHEQTYEGQSTKDLLRKTRLYKVGHHGSHNATLKENGLELMTHPRLVAMVSTDELFAKEQGRQGWLMPNPRVKSRLLSQTKGRLIRGDRNWGDDPDVKTFPPDAEFEENLHEKDPLFVDYIIYDASKS